MQKARGKKGEPWDGVRNFVARNNMKAMKLGDLGFFYHQRGKEVVGIVEVCAPPTLTRKTHWRLEVRRCSRRLRRAEARDPGSGQSQSEARQHGAGEVRALVGAARDGRGMGRGLPHGRA